MVLVDYDFFENEYCGGNAVCDDLTFDRYIKRAVAFFNKVTFGRVRPSKAGIAQAVNGMRVEYTEEQEYMVRMAVCNLIIKMIAFDKTEQAAIAGSKDSSNIKSISSGGESISYGSAETAYTVALTDPKAKVNLFKSALTEYITPEMFDFNPFYAGGY